MPSTPSLKSIEKKFIFSIGTVFLLSTSGIWALLNFAVPVQYRCPTDLHLIDGHYDGSNSRTWNCSIFDSHGLNQSALPQLYNYSYSALVSFSHLAANSCLLACNSLAQFNASLSVLQNYDPAEYKHPHDYQIGAIGGVLVAMMFLTGFMFKKFLSSPSIQEPHNSRRPSTSTIISMQAMNLGDIDSFENNAKKPLLASNVQTLGF